MFQIGHRVYYVWLRNAVSYRRFILPTFIASIAEPVLYLVAMGLGIGSYMGLIEGKPYLHFIAPGLAVSAVMFANSFECTYSSMVRMTIEKVYNAQLVTPVSVQEIVAGEILWGMTRGMVSGVLMLIVLAIMGVARGPWLVCYPLLWAVVGLFFSSLAMVMTSFAKNFDFFTYFFHLFLSPMFFFSGIFFPLADFPAPVRIIANFLPLTHAAEISRSFMRGDPGLATLARLAGLVLFGFVFFCIALRRMKGRIIK